MTEFNEPWKYTPCHNKVTLYYVEDALRNDVADANLYEPKTLTPEQMERAVACVNALAGIPTERILQLEPGAIASALDQADHGGATNLDCSYCSINQCLRLPT